MQILSRWVLKSENNCSVVAFTSRLPREGVTTVTRGLARSFCSAEIGKILLLSSGRKHPRRARVLDVAKQEALDDLSDYIQVDRKLGVDTIRIGNMAHNSFTFNTALEAGELPVPDINFDDDGTILDPALDPNSGTAYARKLFKRLKKKYDIILVDAGSLNNPNGTFWLVNSDVNILVIDCSRTNRESLEYQRSEFENSEISIGGSILNKRKFPIPKSLYWLLR